MDDYANRCGEWLQDQVRRAEATDPNLKRFKTRIAEVGSAIDALNASETVGQEERLKQLLLEQEDAIITLIKYIAQRANRPSAA